MKKSKIKSIRLYDEMNERLEKDGISLQKLVDETLSKMYKTELIEKIKITKR